MVCLNCESNQPAPIWRTRHNVSPVCPLSDLSVFVTSLSLSSELRCKRLAEVHPDHQRRSWRHPKTKDIINRLNKAKYDQIWPNQTRKNRKRNTCDVCSVCLQPNKCVVSIGPCVHYHVYKIKRGQKLVCHVYYIQFIVPDSNNSSSKQWSTCFGLSFSPVYCFSHRLLHVESIRFGMIPCLHSGTQAILVIIRFCMFKWYMCMYIYIYKFIN